MEIYQLSKYIAGIYRRSKTDFNHEIADLNVRATQSDLLMFIHDHPDYTQKQIAGEMVVDPSLLARDLRVLNQAGLVTQQTAPTDGRARIINLTPAGTKLATTLIQTMAQWWTDLFADAPDLDLDVFTTQLGQVYQHILAADGRRIHE